MFTETGGGGRAVGRVDVRSVLVSLFYSLCCAGCAVLSLSVSELVVSVSCCLCRPDCRLRRRARQRSGLETKTSCSKLQW